MFVFEEVNIGRRGDMVVGQGKKLGRFEGVGDELAPYFDGVRCACGIPRAEGNGAIQGALIQLMF